jgi:hypothetical protein
LGQAFGQLLQLVHGLALAGIGYKVRPVNQVFIVGAQLDGGVSGGCIHQKSYRQGLRLALPAAAWVSCQTMTLLTVQFNRWRLDARLLLLLALVLLTACGGKPMGKAAPLGDHAVLEQLADAYRSVRQEYPMSPRSMAPKGRLEFVQRVFQQAGYDYDATLQAMAKAGAQVTNPDHRDLAALLFLPHQGVAEASWADIYSPEELAAIKSIRDALR